MPEYSKITEIRREAHEPYSYRITEKQACAIAFRVNCAHRNNKPVVTSETVFRVASGDYLESHPIDCAILAELRKL